MTDYTTVSFFRDRALQDAPYEYFDWVRDQGPVWQEPSFGVFMVTGHPEAMAVYGDPATFTEPDASGTFSSCNAVSGPFVPFPEPFEGDDVTDLILRYRTELPFSDQLPAFDPPMHTAHRHLLMRLITPKGLKENEDFMWQYADRLLDGIVEGGGCELVSAYAEPFTLTVIADLEGVPEEDHELFRERLSTAHEHMEHKPLEFLYERFSGYIEERRNNPGNDILTGL
ncbi:MAG: cytochrome P450, partial [Acidimicrobiales bacterium]